MLNARAALAVLMDAAQRVPRVSIQHSTFNIEHSTFSL
jgi:hypothetical protein